MLPRTLKSINNTVEQKLQVFYVKTKSTVHKESSSYTPMSETGQENCSPREPEKGAPSFYFLYFIRPILAELLGVLFFVFVGVTCLCPNATGTGRIATALAHGFALFVMVAVMANVRYISRK